MENPSSLEAQFAVALEYFVQYLEAGNSAYKDSLQVVLNFAATTTLSAEQQRVVCAIKSKLQQYHEQSNVSAGQSLAQLIKSTQQWHASNAEQQARAEVTIKTSPKRGGRTMETRLQAPESPFLGILEKLPAALSSIFTNRSALHRATGINLSTINSYCDGSGRPSVQQMLNISSVFNTQLVIEMGDLEGDIMFDIGLSSVCELLAQAYSHLASTEGMTLLGLHAASGVDRKTIRPVIIEKELPTQLVVIDKLLRGLGIRANIHFDFQNFDKKES